MQSLHLRGDVARRTLLLLGLAVTGAHAQINFVAAGFEIDGRPAALRGVRYSPTPIGEFPSDRLRDAGCLYARDFALIAGTGANTLATVALVESSDWAFASALESSGLYWLAGFPLDPYYDPRSSLNASSAGGAALRERILSDFVAWASAWASGGRVAAFVFGHSVARAYNTKFAGSPRDYYSLVNEAAARLAAAGIETPVTATVADAIDLGDPTLGTDDAAQPALGFWSLDQTGRSTFGTLFEDMRARTAKPILVDGFGVDAFDQPSGAEDAETQAWAVDVLTSHIAFARQDASLRLLGGVYNGFVDEWGRGSSDPEIHGAGQVRGAGAPDGALNPGWLGLFGAVRTGIRGLDTLRPRRAYFELAASWNGATPPEVSLPARPIVDADGLINSASGFAILGQGGLFSLVGSALAADSRQAETPAVLPIHLGGVSACLGGKPAPLFAAGPAEIRGQTPWSLPRGEVEAVVYRGGVASNRVAATVEAAAPGILPRGVYRPGLPCPVDEFNGVRPGDVLEIYSTGLGSTLAAGRDGEAPAAPAETSGMPRALWRGEELDVLYSGAFPGVVGVYQTNVRMPASDVPAVEGDLRLEAGGFFSNAHLLRVVAFNEPEAFGLDGPHPGELVVQAGATGGRADVEILGAGAFCGLIRFRVEGAPPGVRVEIPVGYPGRLLPLSVTAEAGAPRAVGVPVKLVGTAVGLGEIERMFRVTVLPGLGDIALSVVSAGWQTGTPGASFAIDGHVLFQEGPGGPGRGVNALTLDAATGVLSDLAVFDTWGSEGDVEALERFLLSVPEGNLVLLAVADDAVNLMTDQTRRVIRETLGSEWIDTVRYQWSWALMGRKGATRPIAESIGADAPARIDRVVSFPLP